jgi:hypothetical protein
MLFCCAILAIVAAFGYSRYKASQEAGQAFSARLQSPNGGEVQLPSQAGSVFGAPSATPAP